MNWFERGPLVVERFLDLDECLAIRKLAEASPLAARSYQGLVDPQKRRTDFSKLDEQETVQIESSAIAILENFFGESVSSIANQSALVYRYPPGVGFIPHHDEPTDIERARSKSNSQPVISGDVTSVIFLSGPDDYAGGELFFVGPDIRLRPPIGTLVAFPATKKWVHGVAPILSGERWTMIIRFQVG
ncbi:2OG-Fe(II) oxygenase [Nocardia vinacea]|uniref:2OG-Fe(II) oxygenase n=1 Tax=Nocardia vinacea TaxID=96468 RepID=UPI000A02C495|nr:2OG-Fe(II) oxygenase [Nocardia vinacea]